MPKLVFTLLQNPFVAEGEFQFENRDVRAAIEQDDDPAMIQICVEIHAAEIPHQSLAKLFATLSVMFAGDAHKNIDFRRGLLRGVKDRAGCTDELWEAEGQLRIDGTFCHDPPVPRK